MGGARARPRILAGDTGKPSAGQAICYAFFAGSLSVFLGAKGERASLRR